MNNTLSYNPRLRSPLRMQGSIAERCVYPNNTGIDPCMHRGERVLGMEA